MSARCVRRTDSGFFKFYFILFYFIYLFIYLFYLFFKFSLFPLIPSLIHQAQPSTKYYLLNHFETTPHNSIFFSSLEKTTKDSMASVSPKTNLLILSLPFSPLPPTLPLLPLPLLLLLPLPPLFLSLLLLLSVLNVRLLLLQNFCSPKHLFQVPLVRYFLQLQIKMQGIYGENVRFEEKITTRIITIVIFVYRKIYIENSYSTLFYLSHFLGDCSPLLLYFILFPLLPSSF